MDRTREALFSSIQDVVSGCRFVDLYSAAGGVGIEALSRGASTVHFVERAPDALACLRRNLHACGVEGQRYRIHAQDVLDFLERGGLEAIPGAIAFADPPYEGEEASILLHHFEQRSYNNLTIFILEHRRAVEADRLGSLRRSRSKRYGDSTITIWSTGN